MDETVATGDVRANLAELVQRVVHTPAVRVFFGPHRRREAVLMAASRVDAGDRARRHLLSAFAEREAATIVGYGCQGGDFDHVGDPMGTVMAWLWRAHPDEVAGVLTEYLDAVRRHPNAPKKPIMLEDVLTALRPALPGDFDAEDYRGLCERARWDVPGYYQGDR